METKKRENELKFFRILLLLFFFFGYSLCGLTVFPDHFLPTDAAFISNKLDNGIKDKQIYKLGYFVSGSGQPDILSYKHALRYKPDYSCTLGTYRYSNNKSNNYFFNHVTSDNSRENNFSEEIQLLRHIYYGTEIQFKAPFPTIHNTGYYLNYKLTIATNNKQTVKFYLKVSSIGDVFLCDFPMEKNTANWFKMTIKTKLITTNKIHMIFNCYSIDDIEFDVEINDIFNLYIKGDNIFHISFYQVTLEDSTTSYFDNNRDNTIIRTYSGLEKCIEGVDDCLTGFKCSSSVCKTCDFTCLECINENNPLLCKTCNTLTDVEKSNSPQCPINNVDITQFKDIEINIKLTTEEFHERSTIGFWLFIADLEKARSGTKNIFHIVLKDRYVISFIPNEASLDVFCHAYEDLYRLITSDTFLASNYIDRTSDYVLSESIPSNDQKKYINDIDISGHWFHTTCALSFDHKKYYLKTTMNGEAYTVEHTLLHEHLYYDSANKEYVENDEYLRHIVREDKKLNLKIKNFDGSDSKIYMKYFTLFQEYIPPNYHYMYYDFTNGLLKSDAFLYQIPFNELITGNTYQIKGYDYNFDEEIISLSPKSNNNINLKPPYNFKPLKLLGTNNVYKYIDCKTNEQQSLVISENEKINWDDNKPLFCYYFLKTKENQCTTSGQKYCTLSSGRSIIYPGMNNQNGYCDYPCSGAMTCNVDRLIIGEHLDPQPTGGVGFCDSSNKDIYNLFFSCENIETKYYLQYSSFYNPGDIYIHIDSLQSYIIELWYYPDFFLSDPTREGKFKNPETYKNYIFYSNVVQAYYRYSNKKELIVEDKYTTLTSPYYHPYEWNKLVFYGLYKHPNYLKTFYINNKINEPVEFSHVKKAEEGTLTDIQFFTEKEIEGTLYRWGNGFYRGLRIWNGDTASFPVTVIYDNFFSSSTGRVNSIVRFYPLTNQYFGNNKIWEILGVENAELSFGSYGLRRYNFASKFDFIRSQYPSLGYFLMADAQEPKVSQCGTGCARCWSAGSNCYECVNGYILTLNRECLPISYYYFKSPCLDSTKSCDALFIVPQEVWKIDDKNNGITVTFWMKPIGFDANSEVLIIQYSIDDKLYFSPTSGLTLKSSVKIIANDPNFREKIGQWTFISLSFYEEKNDINKGIYFNQMISFEINDEIFPIQTRTERKLKFDAFEIFPAFFGLVYNVRYYHEFIIGAYGFATNEGNLISPFTIPIPIKTFLVPGTQPSSCFDFHDFKNDNADNYECVPDYDILFNSFADSFNKYIKYEKGAVSPYNCDFKSSSEDSVAKCFNACKGSGKFSCSCMNKNYNSQMLIRGEVDYCRSLDYINFSKAKKITIGNILTARETKKFTMQFWIFVYNYRNGNFDGATFKWEGHNTIKIINKENKYIITCETWYLDGETKHSLIIDDMELQTAVWKFISCAVNFPEAFFYLNTNSDAEGPLISQKRINPSFPTSDLTSRTVSTLEITDESTLNEWGYLFYRQIHLWKDAYFNAEFLSRVNILTKSKFPYLLHSWDPAFRGYKDAKFDNNFIVSDICGVADDFVVKYQGELGFNVIDETDVKNLTVCSEDGEYYDMTLKKCLQFSDLGSLQDFTFTEIPPSFSGSYSMAFWIFFEDSTTISAGIHFRWERHLQISIIKGAQLQGYCFPQGYYSDTIPNIDITYKYSQLLNAASTYLVSDSSESGTWIFVLCSVSNYAKTYFIRGNGATETKEMIAETLYYSDTTGDVLSIYPYHYYMSEVDETVPKTSSLFFENMKNDKKMYIRNFLLFKDYIPTWYADAFKHTDLSLIEENEMLESMVFVVNFADFNLKDMILTYYVIDQYNAGSSSTFKKTRKLLKLTTKTAASFELCTNFAFIEMDTPKKLSLCKKDLLDNSIDNLYYCSNKKDHLVCKEKKYITKNDKGEVICDNTCESSYMRIPGTPSEAGICNFECDVSIFKNCPSSYAELLEYKSYYKCSDKFDQIGYTCLDKNLDEKSAFFFSRCYNQPNFYGTISNESKKKFEKGYYYEFWFKLDKVLIQNYCSTDADKEYYLYSVPHSIYFDLTENQFYYKIIDSVYSRVLNGINDYEWNKIVIKTSLGVSTGQNVNIYVNFDVDNPKVTITGIESSVNMQLQYISFCSKEENGFCTPAGFASVTWGSAYYRNIRVWELYSSSINSIQDFNINIFEDITKSLILYYPLTIRYMDKNKLVQIIGAGNPDSIQVTHRESTNFNSEDDYAFFNYATNFDWGVEKNENKGKFISAMEGKTITYQDCGEYCDRCYTSSNSNCYKCNIGYILKGMTCVYTDGNYYVKVPANGGEVQFNILYIRDYPGISITFYMKFEGAVQNPVTTVPPIFLLSPSTYLAYNTDTSDLELYIEGQVAFKYTEFYNYIGKWIPISISIYVSEDYARYPHMFTFSLNKEDIPFITGFTLPNSLNRVNFIHLGNEVVSLFADLRVYNTFIQGSFGTAISSDKSIGAILEYSLRGGISSCTNSEQLVTGSGVPPCAEDYIDYIAKSCGTNTDLYFDLSLLNLEIPCSTCPGYCKTKCFNPETTQCTCDMTDGLYWLRRDKTTSQTYCEYLPFIDYSVLKDITIKVPPSKTFESTIEFWIFIYSYNTASYKFNEIILEWNLHNKVDIYNNENTITAKCQALYDKSDNTRYSEYLTLTLTVYQWNLIRCGTDLISSTRKYFLNNQEEELITLDDPDRSNNISEFRIINKNEPFSIGYVFLREIKLWQQYNFKYIDTSYIDLKGTVGTYVQNNGKSSGIFPGLITYIKSEFNPDDFMDVKTYPYKYKIINEVGNDELGAPYPKTYIVERVDGFLGYNIIDPDNNGIYSDLVICEEGLIYNSANNICLEPAFTKCQYAADVSDNCISCPEDNIYLHPENGTCVSNCGVRYYPRNDINECRDCHSTCYECFNYTINSCTSCIDDRYLVENLHICVTHCQEYGLIESEKEKNKCVPFEAEVSIIYPPDVHIDINAFDYILANITYINSELTYMKWSFEPLLTRKANNDTEMEFPLESPFYETETIKTLNVSVNHSFFELRKIYYFTLTLYSYNILNPELTAERNFTFNFTTNSYPVDGGIQIIPSVGLQNTTIFLIRCQNWTDDTTTDLEYYFYSIEDDSDEIKVLQNWCPVNEIITNFTIQKDALPKNDVKVYCIVRDNFHAETEVSTTISVVTSLSSGLYSLDDALDEYYLPNRQITDVELYHLSEVLKSFGYDLYKILQPPFTQTIYSPSLDKTLVTKTDPSCTTDFCNSKGDCSVVDEFLVCYCNEGYTGTNCHIEKNSGARLLNSYKELYTKLIATLQTSITYYEFKVMHNLFNGAQYFSQDTTWFSINMETFFSMAMNSFQSSIDNNTYEYFDFFDYYYTYELDRLNKARKDKMVNTGLNFRNMSIDGGDRKEYKEAFDYIHSKLIKLIYYITSLHVNQPIDYEYSSKNFYIALKSISPTFEENEYFEKRKARYHSVPHFMKCLNWVENTKMNNPYFLAFMIYIEYLNFPFGYNSDIYENNTSPLIELRFLDGTTGRNFEVSQCEGQESINIDMPFTNYRWLDQINEQRKLYDPYFYKAPDDPIFSDPIYINESGYVSNDTVEQRIEKYHRKYNFSCMYFNEDSQEFAEDGVVYTNFTNDTNYIQFNSSHLCRFSIFYHYNNDKFKVSGRFFYVSRPELVTWKGNYSGNLGFIIFIIFLSIYIIFTLILGCYDGKNFVAELLLESLKKEIVKIFLPYRNTKEKETEANRMIPRGLTQDLLYEEKFGKKNLKNKAGLSLGPKEDHPLDNPEDRITQSQFKFDPNSADKLTEEGVSINKKRRKVNEGGKPNFFRGKKYKTTEQENIMTTGNRHEDNFAKEIAKFFSSDRWGEENDKIDPNKLPEIFENKKLERERRLNTYANLSLTFREYLCKNFVSRSILLNPFIHISLFCPRWKKLIVFTSEISVLLLMTTVFLTNDELATEKHFTLLLKYSIFSVLIADGFIHILSLLFQMSTKQRRRLLKLVLTGGQLIVLKEYNEMACVNGVISFIGTIFSYALWLFTLYMCFTFYAVWKVQNIAFLYCSIISILLDFLILDFLYEFFLAILYLGRKGTGCIRVIGEFLSRVRTHRCMAD